MTDERRVADWQEGAGGAGSAPTLEPWIVGLLACPVDRGEVRLFGSELVCDQCGRRYPVRSGIARMVSDEAAGEHKF